MIIKILYLSLGTIMFLLAIIPIRNVRRVRVFSQSFEQDMLYPYLEDAEWVTMQIQVRYFIFWVTVKQYSFINYKG